MFKRSLVTLLLVLAACEKLPPEQEHFKRGFKAYEDGDFVTAVLYLKPLVEAGNPAAQLLMAKMYSHGDGVEEDAGKAELLRNLAAFEVYKKKDYAPGKVRPANETLKGISDRLDYYVSAGENGKTAPKDLAQLLESLQVKEMTDLQHAASVEDAGSAAALTERPIQPAAETSEPVSEPVSAQRPVPAEPPPATPSSDSRRSDQISLSSIHDAAEQGDFQAMELLSAAYANGFYGLTPNATQAKMWSQKAARARRESPPLSSDTDPGEKMPLFQVCAILGTGLLLVAVGLWRWRRSRHHRRRPHRSRN